VTQAELDHAVAQATGESIRVVRDHGFNLLGVCPESLDPDDLSLVLDYASCDFRLGYAPHEIYSTPTSFRRL
jgi:hypothetical protein